MAEGLQIGMLQSLYEKKPLLDWPRLVFAQSKSCKKVCEAARVSCERSRVTIRAHRGTLSRSPHVISKGLVSIALKLFLPSKPTPTSFEHMGPPFLVKAVQPRAHYTVRCKKVERFGRLNTMANSDGRRWRTDGIGLRLRLVLKHYSATLELAST